MGSTDMLTQNLLRTLMRPVWISFVTLRYQLSPPHPLVNNDIGAIGYVDTPLPDPRMYADAGRSRAGAPRLRLCSSRDPGLISWLRLPHRYATIALNTDPALPGAAN